MSNIYENEQCPKDLIEVAMTALKKKPKATRCSNHRTVNLVAHRAKTVTRILTGIERKIEDVLGEDQFIWLKSVIFPLERETLFGWMSWDLIQKSGCSGCRPLCFCRSGWYLFLTISCHLSCN
jgi:hypothetical protein